MSSFAKSLGGVLRFQKWVNYADKVSDPACGGGGFLPEDTAPHAEVPLSKSHIRPQTENDIIKPARVIWRAGSSILKTSSGGKVKDQLKIILPVRRDIKGFSSDSRRRLMYEIASIRRDAELPCFVTLTYPAEFPTPEKSKRHLKIFTQRFRRLFPDASAIWKLEPQERGAPHYHLLVWNVTEQDLFLFVINAWYDIAGNGDENHLRFHSGLLKGSKKCVSKVNSWRGVWSYASKYLGKTFEVAGWENVKTGRFWGHVNKDLIPFGALCEYEISSKKVFHIMRYQRRFSSKKISSKGFTLFCDADQWIKNIFSEVT